MMENNIQFRQIGRTEQLPDRCWRRWIAPSELTKNNNGLTLVLAINYSSRTEITAACGPSPSGSNARVEPRRHHEATISSSLYTAGMPDPDLFESHRGEMRVSNYLLWQISYASCSSASCSGRISRSRSCGGRCSRSLAQSPIWRARSHQHSPIECRTTSTATSQMDKPPPVLDYHVPGRPGPPGKIPPPRTIFLPFLFFAAGFLLVCLALIFTRGLAYRWIRCSGLRRFFFGALGGVVLANAHSSAIALIGGLLNLAAVIWICAGGLYL